MMAIEPNVERADTFLDGVETVLSRNPQCGTRLGHSHVWFVPGWAVNLAIYYTFNDDEVVLLSITKTTPPEA